jgi:Uma2 family endonuclease
MENEVKEPVPKYNYISPQGYLEMERTSEIKHEYYKEEVFAIPGASPGHNGIFRNIYAALCVHLKSRDCKPYGSDLRIHIPSHSLDTYPYISIICGKPLPTDVLTDNIVNPSVIMEIGSISTRQYDRESKSTLYREMETLKEYVRIDSTRILVEHFSKQENNTWIAAEFKKRTDHFYISTIGLTLFLKDVYEDVITEEE